MEQLGFRSRLYTVKSEAVSKDTPGTRDEHWEASNLRGEQLAMLPRSRRKSEFVIRDLQMKEEHSI